MYINKMRSQYTNFMLAFFGLSHGSLVLELLTKMSLKEKIGQLLQIDIQSMTDIDGVLDESTLRKYINEYHVGSIMNSHFSVLGRKGWTAQEWREIMFKIHEPSLYLNKTTKIPIVYGIDSIHGANFVYGSTIFPHQINMGASFNPELVKQIALITAKDTRAAGINWVFSPVLDVAFAPSWPRFQETFGEDPYLASELGSKMIAGLQAEDSESLPMKISACMKHFVGYSAPINGHDRSPVYLPDRLLNQIFLPIFERAVNEGILTAMLGYHEVDGVPMISSGLHTITKLRHELKFEGVLVTDFGELLNLHTFHKVCATEKESIRVVFSDTSVDMVMLPNDSNFTELLFELVADGEIKESRIDESVLRILRFKEKLGLFRSEYEQFSPDSPTVTTVGQDQDWLVSLNAARESITLLRNRGNILPLPHDANILLTGPTADSLIAQSGGWTYHWQGAFSDKEFSVGATVRSSFLNNTKYSGDFYYVDWPKFPLNSEADIPQSVLSALQEKAKSVNAIIVCLGETAYVEKPGDVDDLSLDVMQQEYLKLLSELGPPIIVVLIEGRPRLLNKISESAQAILNAYVPGPLGGKAIVEILLGEIVPSGRIPFTYPKNSADIPYTYYHKPGDLCSTSGGVRPCEVEFHFGSGLSYTDFKYSNYEISKDLIDEYGIVEVQVVVTNMGNIAAKHTVLLFLYDLYRRVTPEYKLLKRFTKVDLEPGESIQLFWILSSHDMEYVGIDHRRILESGEFRLGLGPDSDCREEYGNPNIELCKSFRLELTKEYNPICKKACHLWREGICGLRLFDEMCLQICRDQGWTWNFVGCLEHMNYKSCHVMSDYQCYNAFSFVSNNSLVSLKTAVVAVNWQKYIDCVDLATFCAVSTLFLIALILIKYSRVFIPELSKKIKRAFGPKFHYLEINDTESLETSELLADKGVLQD